MESHCYTCIVRPMCKDPCEPAKIFILERLCPTAGFLWGDELKRLHKHILQFDWLGVDDEIYRIPFMDVFAKRRKRNGKNSRHLLGVWCY